jgi:DNA topoisomerase-1
VSIDSRRGAAKTLRDLGEHPQSGGNVSIMEGKYGPYVKWEKVNATLPKESDPEKLTMAEALVLIDEKAAKKGTRRKASSKKKTAAGKSTA